MKAGYHNSLFYKNSQFVSTKREMIHACRDLGYPSEIREQIKDAKTTVELSNIMADARRKYL